MKVTKDFLQKIFTMYPNFCVDGVNPARPGKDSKDEVEKYQQEMLESAGSIWAEIEKAAEWLNRFPKGYTFNRQYHSYSLKHVYAEVITHQKEGKGDGYLCNGDFILAGLLAGFDIKEYNVGSGDVYFNITGLKQDYRDSGVYRKVDKNGVVVFYRNFSRLAQTT